MEQHSFERGQLVSVEGVGLAQVTRTVVCADKVPCRTKRDGDFHDTEAGVEYVKSICPTCMESAFKAHSWVQEIPSHGVRVRMLFCSKTCADRWGFRDIAVVYPHDIAPLPSYGTAIVTSIEKGAGTVTLDDPNETRRFEPAMAPTCFAGVNRSADPIRLAGMRVTPESITESMKDLALEISKHIYGDNPLYRRLHDVVVDEYLRKKAEQEIPPVFETRRAWWDDFDRLGETNVGFQALLLWDTDEEAQAFIKAKAESCPGCPECEGPFEPGHICPTTAKRRREVSRIAWQRDEGGRRTVCVERALAMEDARALLED